MPFYFAIFMFKNILSVLNMRFFVSFWSLYEAKSIISAIFAHKYTK